MKPACPSMALVPSSFSIAMHSSSSSIRSPCRWLCHALPIVQSTKFDLIINLKTAKFLGLQAPPPFIGAFPDWSTTATREYNAARHLLAQVSNTPTSRYYRGGSWNHLARAKLVEHTEEHLLCIHRLVEPIATRFRHARNDIEPCPEDEVAVAPRDDLVIRDAA